VEESSAAAALPSSSAAVRAGAALGRLDAGLLGILGLVVIAQVSWWHGATAAMLHEYYFHDVYFNADLSQRYENLVVPGSNLFRIRLHPLYPLLAMSWTRGLVGLGLAPEAVVQGYVTLVGLVWIALFYGVLRGFGRSPLVAFGYTLLAATSAAALAWLPIAETYALGSITMLFAFGLLARDQTRRVPDAAWVLAVVLGVSVTLTNVMAPALCTLVARGIRRAAFIGALAVGVTLGLSSLQQVFIPEAEHVVANADRNDFREKRFILHPLAGGPTRVLSVLFAHGTAMPETTRIPHPWKDALTKANPDRPVSPVILSVQHTAVGAGRVVGRLAVAGWLVLFGLGVLGLLRARGLGWGRLAIGGTVVGQLVLHVLYGEESFLYALHVTPLLVLVASFAHEPAPPRVGGGRGAPEAQVEGATLGPTVARRLRGIASGVLVATLALLAVHHGRQMPRFLQALEDIRDQPPQRAPKAGDGPAEARP